MISSQGLIALAVIPAKVPTGVALALVVGATAAFAIPLVAANEIMVVVVV